MITLQRTHAAPGECRENKLDMSRLRIIIDNLKVMVGNFSYPVSAERQKATQERSRNAALNRSLLDEESGPAEVSGPLLTLVPSQAFSASQSGPDTHWNVPGSD